MDGGIVNVNQEGMQVTFDPDLFTSSGEGTEYPMDIIFNNFDGVTATQHSIQFVYSYVMDACSVTADDSVEDILVYWQQSYGDMERTFDIPFVYTESMLDQITFKPVLGASGAQAQEWVTLELEASPL